jgi:hypothetical protein
MDVERQKGSSGEVGLSGGYQPVMVNAKLAGSDSRHYVEKKGITVKAFPSQNHSMTWELHENNQNDSGLSRPVEVWVKIQMTSDVKASFQLSCRFQSNKYMGGEHYHPSKDDFMEIVLLKVQRNT